MTALTSDVDEDHVEAGWRPSRLAWVVWRQHRASLTVLAAVSGALAVVMLWAALRGHAQYTAEISGRCGQLHRCGPLLGPYFWLANANYPIAVTLALRVVPVLAGMFLGAPALAREYERGTAQFAWTQGTGRTRWVLASLVLLAVPVTAIGAALGALATWSLQPFGAVGEASRWQGPFDTTALTLAAWALFAFLLGTAAGAVLRRVVPAMAAAGGAATVLVLVNAWKLHGPLLATGPVVTRTALRDGQGLTFPLTDGAQFFFGGSMAQAPAGSWVLDGWFNDRNGHRLTGAALDPLYQLKSPQQQAWVASHHASVWISYQPGSHFWALQGLESGVLLALALALGAATVLLIRRSST